MANLLYDFEHKGYLGKVVIDPDSDVISGYVVNMDKAGLSFRGGTVTAAKRDFEATIDDYLAYCQDEGIEAEVPKTLANAGY
ncbi:MAG: hypothetical protein WA885_18940 [Phormidesmis sp.]